MAWQAIITEFLPSIAKIGEKISEVVFGERRARARNELDKLKAEEKELMMYHFTDKGAARIIKIRARIKMLQDYLQNS